MSYYFEGFRLMGLKDINNILFKLKIRSLMYILMWMSSNGRDVMEL